MPGARPRERAREGLNDDPGLSGALARSQKPRGDQRQQQRQRGQKVRMRPQGVSTLLKMSSQLRKMVSFTSKSSQKLLIFQ
jgi:hypothetical protein